MLRRFWLCEDHTLSESRGLLTVNSTEPNTFKGFSLLNPKMENVRTEEMETRWEKRKEERKKGGRKYNILFLDPLCFPVPFVSEVK